MLIRTTVSRCFWGALLTIATQLGSDQIDQVSERIGK